jgi:universal stress protein F
VQRLREIPRYGAPAANVAGTQFALSGSMTTINRILVGLDGSPRTAYVLEQAVAIARAQNAKVTLMRAVKVPHELSVEMRSTWMAFEQDMLDGTAVDIGTPWDAICRKATELHASMIVIGSHGYGGLDRLLGTTAGKVVNHADCSVMVVRNPAAASKS